MAKPERKARERRHSSSSYFRGCFGISRKIHSDKTIEDDTQKKKKKTKTTITRWFSRSKNKGEITTKPSNETEKQNLIVEDDDKKTLFRVIRHVSDHEDITAAEEKTKEKDTNEERDINPDPLSFSGNITCHKQDRTKTTGSSESRRKPSRVRKGSRVGRFDGPVIGITIVMLTLMIMMVWGRLCAILCASTWCYFLPRLKEVATTAKRKRSGDERGQRPSDLDLNSEAYKKKVVLDGFLFRQHRVSL